LGTGIRKVKNLLALILNKRRKASVLALLSQSNKKKNPVVHTEIIDILIVLRKFVHLIRNFAKFEYFSRFV